MFVWRERAAVHATAGGAARASMLKTAAVEQKRLLKPGKEKQERTETMQQRHVIRAIHPR
jgi:hypothetical protein